MSPDEEEARWRKVEQALEGHVQEIGTLRLHCKRLENEALHRQKQWEEWLTGLENRFADIHDRLGIGTRNVKLRGRTLDEVMDARLTEFRATLREEITTNRSNIEARVQVLRADLDASVKRIEAYQVTINERLEALEDPEEGPDYDDADDDERDQPEGTARTITINLNIK